MIADDLLRKLIPHPFEVGTLAHARAGWIYPDGSVVPCDPMKHRDALPEEYRERYQELLDQYEDSWNDYVESLEPNDHVEWHYYNPESDCNRSLLRELAERGYMRLGIWRMQPSQEVNIELEGSKNTLKQRHDLLAYLVAGTGAETVYFTNAESYSRKRQRQFG